MSHNTLTVQFTTLSNLFIGGTPGTFEIGGVDLYTVTDAQGLPYIPASSLKGALRHIVREKCKLDSAASNSISATIQKAYKAYLERLRDDIRTNPQAALLEEERFKRMEERYERAIKQASAESLFGMEGFNDTPKLLFADLLPVGLKGELENWFSIDSKNSIQLDERGVRVEANPRTYKTVRPGITFRGEIRLYNIEPLLHGTELKQSHILEYVIEVLDQFNTGMYRLGNSGSRGYGRVKVTAAQGDTENG